MTRKPRPTMPDELTDEACRLGEAVLSLTQMVDDRNVRLHALLFAAAITLAITEEAENSGAAIELYRRLDAATAAVADLMERGVCLPLRK